MEIGIKYYKQAFRKYAEFNGRASRPEYWYFILVNLLIVIAFAIINGATGEKLSVFSSLYSLFVIIPSISIAVRRLHDTNRSGWWLLINLLPLIGALVILYFNIQPSDSKKNKYGK